MSAYQQYPASAPTYAGAPAADPTAVMGRRSGAWLVDALLWLVIAAFLLPTPLSPMAEYYDTNEVPEATCERVTDVNEDAICLESFDRVYFIEGGEAAISLVVLGLVLPLAYAAVQGATGRSPGKALLGVKVVDEQGGKPGFGKSFIRTLLWIVDGFPGVPLVGFIAGVSSKGHRRVGDMAARTFVVGKAHGGPVLVPGMPTPGAMAYPGGPSGAYGAPGPSPWGTPPAGSPPVGAPGGAAGQPPGWGAPGPGAPGTWGAQPSGGFPAPGATGAAPAGPAPGAGPHGPTPAESRPEAPAGWPPAGGTPAPGATQPWGTPSLPSSPSSWSPASSSDTASQPAPTDSTAPREGRSAGEVAGHGSADRPHAGAPATGRGPGEAPGTTEASAGYGARAAGGRDEPSAPGMDVTRPGSTPTGDVASASGRPAGSPLPASSPGEEAPGAGAGAGVRSDQPAATGPGRGAEHAATASQASGQAQAPQSAPSSYNPQWDAARGTYIVWEPNRGKWLGWDDAAKEWKPL